MARSHPPIPPCGVPLGCGPLRLTPVCACRHPLQLMRRMSYNAEEGSWSLRAEAAAVPARAGQGSAARRPASARHSGARYRASGPVLFLDTDAPQLKSLDFASIQWTPNGV